MQAVLGRRCRLPDAIHPDIRPQAHSAALSSPQKSPCTGSIFKAEKTFLARRASRHRDDAAIARASSSGSNETPEPKWRPYAKASRLSYFLWDDNAGRRLCCSAAGRGELNTPEGVEASHAPHAGRSQGQRRRGRVRFRMAALRPRDECVSRAAPVSAVQPRTGKVDD